MEKQETLEFQTAMLPVLERMARHHGLRDTAHFLRLAMEATMPLDEITDLLRQKHEIDQKTDIGLGMISYDRWMVEAMAALLRIASEEKARQRPPERAGGVSS